MLAKKLNVIKNSNLVHLVNKIVPVDTKSLVCFSLIMKNKLKTHYITMLFSVTRPY